MSDIPEWQPGDLALCIKGGVIDLNAKRPLEWPRAGKIYRVRQAGPSKFTVGYRHALWLYDGPDNAGHGPVWAASRFRKVTPPKADEFDREVIELMNSEKVS